MVGRNLHAHPGAALFGVFEDEVNPWIGSTQGYGAFIDETLKIEVLWSPLAVMAIRMPGFGQILQSHLSKFKHIAVWDVVVRGTSARNWSPSWIRKVLSASSTATVRPA